VYEKKFLHGERKVCHGERSVAIHLLRHCELSAAIHDREFGLMDCRGFASQ
jgi:hypothetical protein